MHSNTHRKCSKGRKQYYYYYHCSSACGCRYKAEEVNTAFLNELKKYQPKPGIAELVEEVIRDLYNTQYATKGAGRTEILKKIDELNVRMSKGRDLLLTGDLDGNDFRLIKRECEDKIIRLEAKLTELSTKTFNIDSILTQAIANLTNLPSL
ncbi:MAG: hypothetical protein H7Y07_07625 [Pyrinomonadaceae bacterium]|nr:hypothetical protein [Sphingobacteriaceae bacterium]